MNKSKFLKKSLATILAVMMIVAMIPLGASAATAPVISSVKVNGVAATLDGTTYTAEITNPGTNDDDVQAEVTLRDGVGSILHVSSGALQDTTANGVTTIHFSADEISARSAEFTVFDNDLNVTGTYKITFTIKSKNTDTSVKSVTVAGQYGSTKVEGTAYTVIVPYGSASTQNATIKLNSATSVVDSPATGSGDTYELASITVGDPATNFVVRSQAGSTATYSVKLVYASAFTSFSVKGERKAAGIGGIDDGVAANTIEVRMPYGSNATSSSKYLFTPTFTTGYSSVTVKASKDNGSTYDTVIKSGEEIDLGKFVTLTGGSSIDGAALKLRVTYTGSATEDWTVNFDVPADDPVPAITSLKIANFVGEINDRTITISLPTAIRNTTTQIDVGASTGAVVDVVGTMVTATAAGGTAALTMTSLAAGNDNFVLRVTAPGTDEDAGVQLQKDYYLTIKTSDAVKAQVNKMYLVNPANEKEYEAAIDQTKNTITFPVPYSVKQASSLVGWKLYYELTSGSTIVGGSATAVPASGTALTSTETTAFFPTGDGTTPYDGKTAGTETLVVDTASLTSKTYSVYLKNEAANKDATMTGFTITSATKYVDITENNSYKVDGSTTLTKTIPYGEYAKYDGSATPAYVAATIPDGARLFYLDTWTVGGTKTLKALDVMTEDDGDDAAAKTNGLPTIAAAKYDGETKTNGQLTPLTLVVVSESVDAADGDTYDSAFVKENVGRFKTYTLTLKKAAARSTASLRTISVYDAASEKKVNGTISSDNQITISLPYYFDATKAGQIASLYLDYTVAGGEKITVNSETVADAVNPLTFKADGSVDASSEALVADYDGVALKYNASTAITQFVAHSEDGQNTTTYTLTVKFDAPQKGAVMNSVKINNVVAKPDASNKITVNLPFASEVTHLVPTFDVSPNAYVKDSANSTFVPGTAYNFTDPQTFVVYSEDGQNTSTYTITVTTSDEFIDVKKGDWFYEDVMKAAAMGIVVGVGDNKFNPNGKVTRAQFATMIARADGFNQEDYLDQNPFIDVKGSNEMTAAIAYCADKGYINGVDGVHFNPNATITREQMAKIVALSLGLNPVSAPTSKFADDSQIAGWAKGYVYACVDAGVINGMGANKFQPKGTTTRAQAAKVSVKVSESK